MGSSSQLRASKRMLFGVRAFVRAGVAVFAALTAVDSLIQALSIVAFLFLSINCVFAQGTLALSSGTAAANSSAALNLTLTFPAGSEPAGLQWTLTYSPTSIISISAIAGASANAAGKSLYCSASSGSYICLLAGLNTAVMQNGVVAVVSVTIGSGVASTTINVTNTLGASAEGNPLPINGVGGTVTAVPPPPPTLRALNCAPASLGTGGSSTCTVSLNTPASAGGAVVALSDDATALTVPASVTVGLGSTTATFTATAGTIASNQTATITATLNGSTQTATITLAAPVVLSGLTCNPASLVSGGSATCTVTVSQTGGATITLSSNAVALTVPASAAVGSGSTTATFTATAGTIASNQTATITATLNGSTQTATISLATQPIILSVASAASYIGGSLSPGEMVNIFGTAIGPATAAYAITDPATGRLATMIGGVQALFNGIPAPMIYASSEQVSAVVPYEIAPIPNPSVWIRYVGQTSNAYQLNSAPTVPGLFTQNSSGSGPGAILNQDNSLNGLGNPAAKGSIVQVYLTGEGQTIPQGVTGAITTVTLPPPQVTPAPVLPIGVTINGQPALYVYAGEAPGLVAGVMQLNVQIPSNAQSGPLPITVSIGGNTSQNGVTVSVR